METHSWALLPAANEHSMQDDSTLPRHSQLNSMHGSQAYGQTTYLITTMQRVPRGTEGAVSAEGTAAGAAAAVLFAGMAVLVGQVSILLFATAAVCLPQSAVAINLCCCPVQCAVTLAKHLIYLGIP